MISILNAKSLFYFGSDNRFESVFSCPYNVLPITRGRATPSFAQRRAAQPFRRVDWPVGRRAATPAQMAERPECSESLLPVKKWSELKAMNK